MKIDAPDMEDEDSIERLLETMSDHVKSAVEAATQALIEGNAEAAQRVIDSDAAVNSCEVEIDQAIHAGLSGEDPDDVELRWLLAIQKANVAIERIGDHAVNIAESVLALGEHARHTPAIGLVEMATKSREMLDDALTAFLEQDPVRASSVLQKEEEIDAANAQISEKVRAIVAAGSMGFDEAMDLVRISRNYERIADLSTNIAEEVMFSVQGMVIKHGGGAALRSGEFGRAAKEEWMMTH